MANGFTYLASATSNASAYGLVAVGDIDANAYLEDASTAMRSSPPRGVYADGGTGATASPLHAESEMFVENINAVAFNNGEAYLDGASTAMRSSRPRGVYAEGGISANADIATAEINSSVESVNTIGGSGATAYLDGASTAMRSSPPRGISAEGGIGATANILEAESIAQAIAPEKSANANANISRSDSSSTARVVPSTGGIEAEVEMVPAKSETSTYEMDITAGTGATVVIHAEIQLSSVSALVVDGGTGAIANAITAEFESSVPSVTATGSTTANIGVQTGLTSSIARQVIATGGTASNTIAIPAQSTSLASEIVATGGISVAIQPDIAVSQYSANSGSVVGTSGATIQMPRASASATVANMYATGDVIHLVPPAIPGIAASNYIYIHDKMIKFKTSDVSVVVGGQWKSAAAMKISHNGKWVTGA